MSLVAMEEVSQGIAFGGADAEELAKAAEQGGEEMSHKKGGEINIRQAAPNLQPKRNFIQNRYIDAESEKQIRDFFASGGKMEEVKAPDESEYRKKMDELDKQLAAARGKKQVIDKKTKAVSGSEEYRQKRRQHADNLADIRKQINEAEEKKKVCFGKLKEIKQKGKESRASVMSERKRIGYSNAEEIDKAILDLEEEIITSSSCLKSEKKTLATIQLLREKKSAIEKLNSAESTSKQNQVPTEPIKNQYEYYKNLLAKLYERRNAEQEKMTALQNQRKKDISPLLEVYEEKNALQKEISQLFEKKKKIHAEYVQQRTMYEKYRFFALLTRAEKNKEARARKIIEDKKYALTKQLADLEVFPEQNDLTLVTQTINYVNELIEQRDSTATAIPTTNTDSTGDSSTCVASPPKGKRTEQYFIAPKKTSKKKFPTQNNANNVLTKDSKKNQDPKKAEAKFEMSTLQTFSSLNINPPIFGKDYEDCVVELNKKKSALEESKKAFVATYVHRKQIIEKEIAAMERLLLPECVKEMIAAAALDNKQR